MSDLIPQQRTKPQLPGTVAVPEEKAGTPAPPARLTAAQRAALNKAQQQANVVREAFFPSMMAAAIPVTKDIGASAFRLYLNQLLQDAGNPTDPIERMLLEQLALAHYRIAELHVQVEQSRTAEEVKVYSTAAVRLTGEFRRLALALRQYRQPLLPKRTVAFIKQQNVAAGDQQVAYLDQNAPQEQVPLFSSDGRVPSRRLTDAQQAKLAPESSPCGGRSAELVEAGPVDGGRPRAAAAERDQEPTVAVVDGSTDTGGQSEGRSERP